MKSKLTSLSLVLISSLLLAGCTKQAATTQTPSETQSEATEFARAIESGNPTLCTLTKGNDSIEYLIKGKMFKMTSHITLPSDENIPASSPIPQTAYTVSDSLYFYSWSDQSSQGVKTKIPTPEEIEAMDDEAEPQATETPEFNSEADYDAFKNQGYTINCVSASVKDSDFLPPTEIKFIDPAEIMKTVVPSEDTGSLDMKKLQEMADQYQSPE